MGSPLGPLLADVFLGKIESTKLNGFIDKCTIYKRYVDDIFCVIEEIISVQPVWALHNSRIKYLVLLPVSVYILLRVPVEHRSSGVLQEGCLIKFVNTNLFV